MTVRLNNRAGEVTDQIPNPVAGIEERLAKDEGNEKNCGHNDGKEGPGLDVELVVGLGFGAHGRKGKRKKEKGKGRKEGGDAPMASCGLRPPGQRVVRAT